MATATITIASTGGHHVTGENPVFELEKLPNPDSSRSLIAAVAEGGKIIQAQLGENGQVIEVQVEVAQETIDDANTKIAAWDAAKVKADGWEPTWTLFVHGRTTAKTPVDLVFTGVDPVLWHTANQALSDGVTVTVTYTETAGVLTLTAATAAKK